MNPGTRHVAGWMLALGGCVGVVAARVSVGEPPDERVARVPARVVTVTQKRIVVVPRSAQRATRPPAHRAPSPRHTTQAPAPARDRSTPTRPAREGTPTAVAPAPTRRPAQPRPQEIAPQQIDGRQIATRYGPVQVRVTLDGDRITDVVTIAAPDEVARSRQITADAMPQLRQQVLDAQSAAIDGVAGATYTADGYRASVQSALDVA